MAKKTKTTETKTTPVSPYAIAAARIDDALKHLYLTTDQPSPRTVADVRVIQALSDSVGHEDAVRQYITAVLLTAMSERALATLEGK